MLFYEDKNIEHKNETECFELMKEWRNRMRWMEIDKMRTSVYQQSTNGAVERFHRTLNTMMGKVVSQSKRDWDERLPAMMAAYRAFVRLLMKLQDFLLTGNFLDGRFVRFVRHWM